MVLQFLTGVPYYSTFCFSDINGDGKIGLEEAVYILQKLAEIR